LAGSESQPPSIDFEIPLNTRQAEAVAVLFENRFDKIVVEFRGELREFGDNAAALDHALARKEADAL